LICTIKDQTACSCIRVSTAASIACLSAALILVCSSVRARSVTIGARVRWAKWHLSWPAYHASLPVAARFLAWCRRTRRDPLALLEMLDHFAQTVGKCVIVHRRDYLHPIGLASGAFTCGPTAVGVGRCCARIVCKMRHCLASALQPETTRVEALPPVAALAWRRSW
jgi:hypothetical protein